jgi:hypothetical protein
MQERLEAAVRACLENNAGKTVERVSEGVPKCGKSNPE